MRDLAYAKFVAARVIEHVRANPPTEPLLVETDPRDKAEVCQRGHAAMTRQKRQRRCSECDRQRKAERRRRA